MSAHLVERSSTKATGLVAALVDSGIVAPEDRSRAIAILDHQLGRTAGETPRSKILAEIAGYAGGILVVAAGAVFLAASWREMSLATRVGALLLGALVLAGAGLGARLTGRDTPEDADVRRRLAGAFGIGSAALATGALGTYIEHQHHTGDGWIALVFGAFTVLALGFYVLAPTVPGQAAVGFGVAATVLNATSGYMPFQDLMADLLIGGMMIDQRMSVEKMDEYQLAEQAWEARVSQQRLKVEDRSADRRTNLRSASARQGFRGQT